MFCTIHCLFLMIVQIILKNIKGIFKQKYNNTVSINKYFTRYLKSLTLKMQNYLLHV